MAYLAPAPVGSVRELRLLAYLPALLVMDGVDPENLGLWILRLDAFLPDLNAEVPNPLRHPPY